MSLKVMPWQNIQKGFHNRMTWPFSWAISTIFLPFLLPSTFRLRPLLPPSPPPSSFFPLSLLRAGEARVWWGHGKASRSNSPPTASNNTVSRVSLRAVASSAASSTSKLLSRCWQKLKPHDDVTVHFFCIQTHVYTQTHIHSCAV